MTTTKKQRIALVFGIPALIFIACTVITFTSQFREHADRFSLAITFDLLITSPVAYYFVIRKTAISKFTVLRVFMAGVFIATILLSKGNSEVLNTVKTWVAPLVELTFIAFIVWKFYAANKTLRANHYQTPDFLFHCRAILRSVFGNEKFANAFASEIAVFYYTFSRKDKAIDYKTRFTCYKENGIILVLSTFLFIFLLETISMHFVFLLWSETAAWILTALSIYTCLQLFAHMKALSARPHIISQEDLILRNGLLGGDVIISLRNISKIEITNKLIPGKEVVKLALIKGLENHNLAIFLSEPIVVLKAFGMKKTAQVILVHVDKHKSFMETFESYRNKITI